MTNHKPDAASQKIRDDALKQLRRTREQIDPKILQLMQQAIAAQKPQKAVKTSPEKTIKIDKQRNVRFVMDFLQSPAGASLRDKILN